MALFISIQFQKQNILVACTPFLNTSYTTSHALPCTVRSSEFLRSLKFRTVAVGLGSPRVWGFRVTASPLFGANNANCEALIDSEHVCHGFLAKHQDASYGGMCTLWHADAQVFTMSTNRTAMPLEHVVLS
jgi:hypothetical protein